MNGYIAFAKKELMESTRNFGAFAMLVLFLIIGLMNPLTAKFLPEILASFSTDSFQINVPEPTALDSWVQFYKNVSQLGFVVAFILFSSCLSNEYAKGTLVILLSKGLPRPAVVLSKFFVSASILTLSLWMCFGVTYGYTALFWPGTSYPHTVLAAFALWIVGLLLLSALIFGCVLFRQAFASIFFLIAFLGVLLLGGIPTQIANYNPLVLASRNVDLLSGAVQVSDFTVPIVVSLALTVAFVSAAVAVFNKKQV